MSVSETVVALSAVVAHCRAPLSPFEADLAARLQEMPTWVTARQLDEWERRYEDRRSGWGDSIETAVRRSTVELLDRVFEFGRYNLYTRFDLEATEREYRELLAELNEGLGTELRPDRTVSDW